MPGEDARVGVLRGLVPSFRELRGQRLTNALLRSELQRHVGGVVHLPPEFRRKRADQQHFITGQPKREVLLAAWDAFTTVPEGGANKFDPGSVYADWALQGANRGRPAASAEAAATSADSVHEPAHGAPAHMGQTSMEPWMQGVWVNLVDLKLARWKRHNAPPVLAMLRHQRTVAGAHPSASAQFRDDVAQLMQSAVSLLFVRHNRDELFNCKPAQIACNCRCLGCGFRGLIADARLQRGQAYCQGHDEQSSHPGATRNGPVGRRGRIERRRATLYTSDTADPCYCGCEEQLEPELNSWLR